MVADRLLKLLVIFFPGSTLGFMQVSCMLLLFVSCGQLFQATVVLCTGSGKHSEVSAGMAQFLVQVCIYVSGS